MSACCFFKVADEQISNLKKNAVLKTPQEAKKRHQIIFEVKTALCNGA